MAKMRDYVYGSSKFEKEINDAVSNAGTPEGTSVKSTGATSGKVLTANGSGGASWETASGGGSLYMHTIHFYNADSIDYGPVNVYFMFISTSSTAITSAGDIPTGTYPATGVYHDSNSGTEYWTVYIDTYNESVGYVDGSGYINDMMPFDFTLTSVTDTVTQIL